METSTVLPVRSSILDQASPKELEEINALETKSESDLSRSISFSKGQTSEERPKESPF